MFVLTKINRGIKKYVNQKNIKWTTTIISRSVPRLHFIKILRKAGWSTTGNNLRKC